MKENVVFMANDSMNDSHDLKYLFTSFAPMYLFETNTNVVFEANKLNGSDISSQKQLSSKNDPATSVFIATSSIDDLAIALKNMKNSTWWNHDAWFLIANTNIDNGCRLARRSLSTVWSFNILNVIYLCYNHDNQIMLYNFNPYTNLAPKFWSEVQDSGPTIKFWTLFQHSVEFSLSSETSLINGKYNC